MKLPNLIAQADTHRFFDWFRTPAREVFGGVLVLIALLVIFLAVEMIPDMIRYIRMSRK